MFTIFKVNRNDLPDSWLLGVLEFRNLFPGCPWRIANLGHNPRFFFFLITCRMRDLILLFVHVVTVLIRLVRPGGMRAVLAESVLLRHQLLILNRSRHRGPNLRTSDRLVTGWCAILVLPRRLVRSAIVVKPSSLLNFHRALVHRKYRLLFSAKRRARPGPKGPSADLIRALVDMKQRNPRWGCRALPSRLPWPSVSTSRQTLRMHR